LSVQKPSGLILWPDVSNLFWRREVRRTIPNPKAKNPDVEGGIKSVKVILSTGGGVGTSMLTERRCMANMGGMYVRSDSIPTVVVD
jgi:hypothetical protein